MATPIGIWQISERGPQRLPAGDVGLERNLEEWIEKDPGLLEAGLTIVGRQLVTEGGRLDLLALDTQGSWVVIEIKSGAVRRDTIAQALDYASCVARLSTSELEGRVDRYLAQRSDPAESRSLAALLEARGGADADGEARRIRIFVVGTGRDPGLERMVDYLSEQGGIEITVVSFEVFRTTAGEQILSRELTEADEAIVLKHEAAARQRVSVDDLFKQAREQGTEEPFRMLYDAATDLGLYPRLWGSSIMYAPPSRRTRCLFVMWTKPYANGDVRCYAVASAFEEFYGIPEERAGAELRTGENGRLPPDDMPRFVAGLRRLLGDER